MRDDGGGGDGGGEGNNLFPQTELGVLTFFPRSKSGWSLRFVGHTKTNAFFNENHNILLLTAVRAIYKIVDPPLFSYVPSDIDIDFLKSFKNSGNRKSR